MQSVCSRLFLVIGCLGLFSCGVCRAGGGPENVLLVVNLRSEDSITIANYYARLRDIPPENILYLDWNGKVTWELRKWFGKNILAPIIETIKERGLTEQIDYVVYSVDFPWGIRCQDMFPELRGPEWGAQMASITGATYLYPEVLGDSRELMSLASNWYVPNASLLNLNRCTRLTKVKTRGFRSRYAWNRNGQPTENPKEGRRYLMSSMLGVTQGRSSTVEEVANSLVRAVAADGTRPDGTFYFMRSEDIRSKTRHDCFESIAEQLRAEGAKAKVLEGGMPKRIDDALGITTGKPNLMFTKGKVIMRPGSFGDNLTSFGGDFRASTGQTTLDEFLRAGAAGASGTVMEPYALQTKFPLPSIHLHYYRGCSLAEAFYQSVFAPYQILLVGDPLCQPWAKRPTCSTTLPPHETTSGMLKLQPKLSPNANKCEVFVDGRLKTTIKRGESIALDTSELPDGFHQLQMVAIGNGPIETRGREVLGINVDNKPDRPLVLNAEPSKRVSSTETLTLTVAGPPQESEVVYLHNSREIGRGKGPDFRLEVDPSKLGRGPVRLIATNPATGVQSPPVWVWVE